MFLQASMRAYHYSKVVIDLIKEGRARWSSLQLLRVRKKILGSRVCHLLKSGVDQMTKNLLVLKKPHPRHLTGEVIITDFIVLRFSIS